MYTIGKRPLPPPSLLFSTPLPNPQAFVCRNSEQRLPKKFLLPASIHLPAKLVGRSSNPSTKSLPTSLNPSPESTPTSPPTIPLSPRLIVDLVDASLARAIADQNPDPHRDQSAFIVPIFKSGFENGETVSWVCEVTPKYYPSILDEAVFLGFTRSIIKQFDTMQKVPPVWPSRRLLQGGLPFVRPLRQIWSFRSRLSFKGQQAQVRELWWSLSRQ